MSNDSNPYSRENNPAGQSSQQQYDAAQQNRTRAKNSWMFVGAMLLGLFTTGLICCGGFAYFGVRTVSGFANAPVNAAIAYVSSDEEIANKLGTPIESTSTVGVNNYQNNNNNGSASVDFNAKGPNGTANVEGKMTLTAGTWTVDKLTVTFPDGSSVELPRADEQPADDGADNVTAETAQ